MATTPKGGAQGVDLPAIAQRIEKLVEALQSSADAHLWSQIEDLVRALTDLYGAGLTRTVDLAEQWAQKAATGAGSGGDLLAQLAGDELLASLLVLHGVHPDGLVARAARAVDAAAPTALSNGGELRLVGVDSESGTVSVSVVTTGSGCGFDPEALVDVVRQSLWDALPDASTIQVEVEVDRSPVATPVRLSRKRASAGAGS